MSMESVLLEVEKLSDSARAQAWERVHMGASAETRRRRGATMSAVGLAAVGTATVLLYPALYPTSVYAAWTAVPRPALITADDPRVQSCRSSLPARSPEFVGDAQRLVPVVAESRGPFTAALLGAGDSIAVCIFDESNGTTSWTEARRCRAARSCRWLAMGVARCRGRCAVCVRTSVGFS